MKTPDIAQVFQLELRNRFEVLAEIDEVEGIWQEFKSAASKSSEKVLGFKKRKKANWIYEADWKKINERN